MKKKCDREQTLTFQCQQTFKVIIVDECFFFLWSQPFFARVLRDAVLLIAVWLYSLKVSTSSCHVPDTKATLLASKIILIRKMFQCFIVLFIFIYLQSKSFGIDTIRDSFLDCSSNIEWIPQELAFLSLISMGLVLFLWFLFKWFWRYWFWVNVSSQWLHL